ncbi:MAG: hypothetical protein IT196_21670, partial [Acidimicrobiales bacterium]|nr:hypothetical protein [Acidimicrobiales bacterium]
MSKGQFRVCLAALVGVSLVGAACGGDDGGGSGGAETANTIDKSINQALQSTTTAEGGTATTAAAAKDEPQNMEEWEALWAEERTAIVERIKENKWGLSADGKPIT